MAQTCDFVSETEETEAYLEFTAQEECRALPGHLDLERGKSLSPARRQDGFAQNLSMRDEKGAGFPLALILAPSVEFK